MRTQNLPNEDPEPYRYNTPIGDAIFSNELTRSQELNIFLPAQFVSIL
jgi:hypothetical protein